MAEIGTEATLPLYERSGMASAAVFGDLAGIADRRTLEILERRRTSNPHRRGWLVRRLLVLADVVGLVLAFAAVELVFGAGGGAGNRVTSVEESLLLLVTLPGWIVIAKLYRLYDQDEERTHHPTTDDFSGVFHLVTVGVWLFYAGTWALGIQLNYDIGGLPTTLAERAAQAQALKKSKADAEKQASAVILDVRSCIISLERTRRDVALTRGSVDQATENLRVARQRLSAGTASDLDVLTSEFNLLKANFAVTNRQIDAQIATADLARAIALDTMR